MLRPCLDCGKLSSYPTRCPPCRKAYEAMRSAGRPRRLHYGGDYRKRAKAIRESATSCYWCLGPFTPKNPVQADHVIPQDPESPLVPSCRRCNIRRAHGLPPAT